MVIGARAALPSVASRDLPSVSRAQMAEVDRLAIDEFGISLLQMMEQAGSHLAEVVRLEVDGELRGRPVIVAVGPGNNGGGGLVAARHLANRGAVVRVILARPALRLADAARHQLATVLEMMVPCCVAFYDLPDEELQDALASADVVVDAILGYSVSGPPHGEVDRLIGHVMESGRPVVSLDLPSGLDPDTGEAAGRVVTARATMTLGLPKAGLLSGPGRERSGRLYLADIGLPAALYRRVGLAVDAPFEASRIVRVDWER